MKSLEARLSRLEYEDMRRQTAAYADRAGISADRLWAECMRVFALPDADQRRYFERLYGDLTDAEAVELDGLRRQWMRMLRGAS